MYEPDNTETLYRIKDINGVHQIAMDLETYAHCLNNPGIEVLEEVMTIERKEDEEKLVADLLERRSSETVYPLTPKEEA